jgi:hypothetical protein
MADTGGAPDGDTQEVHDLFRGAAEVSKAARLVAFLFELVAVAIALEGIFSENSSIKAWRPLLAFGLTFASWLLREYASHASNFADQCRRAAMRAYATESVIARSRSSEFRSDAPLFAAKLAKLLPAKTLNDYYEPKFPPGEDRLRELYAHSAFYTWRILRVSASFYSLASAALFVTAVVVLYQLVIDGPLTDPDVSTVARHQVLEALFSIVLGIVGLRGLAVSLASILGTIAMRKVADALIRTPLPAAADLDEWTESYDFERAGAPSPPTALYWLMRDKLAADWHHRRGALTAGR